MVPFGTYSNTNDDDDDDDDDDDNNDFINVSVALAEEEPSTKRGHLPK